MSPLPALLKRARLAIWPAVAVLLLGYFTYHVANGERGLIAWWHLNREVRAATAVLASLRAEQAALEHRVRLLRRDNLDPDLLEERARIMLNMGRPGDLIILDRPQ